MKAQHLVLTSKIIKQPHIIWFDANNNNDLQQQLQTNIPNAKFIVKHSVIGNELDNIDPNHTIVISSGALKQQVFDNFQEKLKGISGFVIYCGNVSYHKEGALNYSNALNTIVPVTSEQNELIKILMSTANNMASQDVTECALYSQALRQSLEDIPDEFTDKLKELIEFQSNGREFLSQNNIIDNYSNHLNDTLINYCDENNIYYGSVLMGEYNGV
jgi:hypothetical protein